MVEEAFPRAGFRARLWRRFERDLRAWLATPEGRFAVYCAERDRTDGKQRPALATARVDR
ncbi:MAG: hypothetical protein ACRDGE_07190 [Candidatus Limnocylindria bacterium]